MFTPAKPGVDGQVHGFFYGYGALAVLLVLFQARPPAFRSLSSHFLAHTPTVAIRPKQFALDCLLPRALGTRPFCAMHAALDQAFHGLAVTLVYKYADAIVKNFANSAVMAILVVLSAYLFNTSPSVSAFAHECPRVLHLAHPSWPFCCMRARQFSALALMISSNARSSNPTSAWPACWSPHTLT